MNISFLVGNGFDIASGIDTSYSAFYKWYCSQTSGKPHIDAFKRDIKNDMDNGGENWADFEIGLGRYTAKFTTETVNDFIECYEDAQDNIAEYLEKECKKFSGSISDTKSQELREGVAKFYQELPPAELNKFEKILKSDEPNNSTIQLISFNYTTLLDKCAEVLAKEPLKQWMYGGSKRQIVVKQSVIHIHGTLNEFPVLGVNDPSQIKNKELLSVPQFSEMMIKPQSVEAIGQLWHNQAVKAIEESQIICIMGMSLGDSDSIWWQRIMSWLKENTSRRLLIFWHTAAPMNGRSVFRHAREVAEAKSKIADYSDFTEDVLKSIKERIHVVLNTKKFLKVSFTETPKVGMIVE